MPALDLSVVIANYNGERWLQACLNSLIAQAQGTAWEIILVDNGSEDGSTDLIEQRFPQVRLVVNAQNLGFAKATNQGIALSRGEYILLLNTDTVFQAGLTEMMEFLDERPDCAAVGPSMADGQGHPTGSWGYFPTLSHLTSTMLFLDRLPLVRSWFHPLLFQPGRREFSDGARPVDWASGACLLLRREVVEQVGPLDESYFMYGEDVEWCYRVWQHGYELWFLPQARLLHHGAGGKEWRSWKGPLATVHTSRHFLYFSRKHLPAWQRLPVRFVLAAGISLRLLWSLALRASWRTSTEEAGKRMTAAYLDALRIVLGPGSV